MNRWVVTTYLVQALPYTLVTAVSVILYKNLNFSNTDIAFYTSLLTIPWFIKPILSPLIEHWTSRRTLILWLSLLTLLSVLLLTFTLSLTNFFYPTLLAFLCIAFFSSLYDLNVDGLYITELNPQLQARYIGIRNLSYQFGRLLCQGGLVFIASQLFLYFEIKTAWQIALILLASILLMLIVYHLKSLPNSSTTFPKRIKHPYHHLKNVFKELCLIPHCIQVIFFILIYHLAENQLIKIVPLFLLDKISHGGLALSTAAVGILDGGIGITAILAGLLLSSFILERISLKKCLIPMTIFAAIANLGYLLLSLYNTQNLFLIGTVIAVAQFGFGLSNGAYMYYLLQRFGKGNYPMSLYATGTTLMGLSVMLGGAMSGYLQSFLGYEYFFLWIGLSSLGIVIFVMAHEKRAENFL